MGGATRVLVVPSAERAKASELGVPSQRRVMLILSFIDK